MLWQLNKNKLDIIFTRVEFAIEHFFHDLRTNEDLSIGSIT